MLSDGINTNTQNTQMSANSNALANARDTQSSATASIDIGYSNFFTQLLYLLLPLLLKLLQEQLWQDEKPLPESMPETKPEGKPEMDQEVGQEIKPDGSSSTGAAGNPGADGKTNAISSKQVFNTPTGAQEPGPALPGNSYETTFKAQPGEKLSFASMLVQSNDLFFAPDEDGIPLYDSDGQPLQGDVTGSVALWDAGTEIDEPAGTGENQAPRQAGPNTGADDPDNRVRRVNDSDGEIPAVNELIQANIEYLGDNEFKLSLNNISDTSALPGPIAPGVAVVHSQPAPIFGSLQPDRGLGLEALAEDGDPSVLLGQL